MSVNIVTGLTGKSHVTSAQDGRKNAFAFGSGRYVFDSGSKFAYELVSNNLIKILDGDLIDQGRHICTDQNDYTELTIDNGISGNNRKDLIVMRYQKNADTSIESASLVVIKGTSTSGVASDPDYTEGDILSGDLVDDFPLYRVNLTGLSITSVDQLFETLPVGGIHGILSQIDMLNTNLAIRSQSGIWTRTIGKVKEIFFVLPVKISSTYSTSTGMYFSTVNATLPSDISISDKTYMNVQATVQSSGIYLATFVDYNITAKIFTFYISNVKEFSNIDVKLHVSIKIPSV